MLHSKIAAYRTYAIAVRIRGESPERALSWDAADPYHYIRQQNDPGGEVWIVGGEDHKTGQHEDAAICYENLEKYVRSKFGSEVELTRWSGQILESVDGLPYIGRDALAVHIYVATGFSGNGMTLGTIAGLTVSDLIQKKENRWAELYKATRVKSLSVLKDFIIENKDYPLCLIGDRVRSAEADSVREIAPGDGKRIKLKDRVLAVSRDENGELHAVSAVCTHLGCHVRWNGAASTWDCPCHGSRFGRDGKVINGPALADLEVVPIEQKKKKRPKEKAA